MSTKPTPKLVKKPALMKCGHGYAKPEPPAKKAVATSTSTTKDALAKIGVASTLKKVIR
jgi:hypothetical protein